MHSKGELELEHVEISHAGREERDGALLVGNKARASVKNTAFDANPVGMVAKGRESKLTAFDANSFENTPVAIRLLPGHFAALGSENSYAGNAKVIIEAGAVGEDATWKMQKAATVELGGKLAVDNAALTIEPGFVLHVADAGSIEVGYYGTATMNMIGRDDAPITVQGAAPRPGAGSRSRSMARPPTRSSRTSS